MPLIATVAPDAGEIFRLIKEQDRYGAKGAVTRFARRLREPRRHPQTFWNMRAGRRISLDFAEQIAGALKVSLDDITLPVAPADPAGWQDPRAEAA